MRCNLRWILFSVVICCLAFLLPTASLAEPLKMSSSTQLLWGDDLGGDGQVSVAQYLRFSYKPENQKFSVTGYGRLSKDIESGSIRNDDFNTRLYYLYVDYRPIENLDLRVGRQFINLSAGSSLMDGATLNINKIGPVGLTLAGGRDVVYSLDSETTRGGNYFAGVDLHLQGVKNTQLGVSYVRKYDDSDLSREEFGLNFRYIYKWLSPYAEVKYDRLSKAFDEATAGIDLFPASNLALKAEFYHSYPTFDATSIFSVFAVDKFREYLLSAEYTLPTAPISVFGQYKRQTYDDDSNADVFALGLRVFPTDNLTVSTSVDYRRSFEDKDWGFELTGDYKISKKFLVGAGVQHNAYQRPDEAGTRSAQRLWVGGRWQAMKNIAVTARLEDNANESFRHRTLGRMTLDWNL